MTDKIKDLTLYEIFQKCREGTKLRELLLNQLVFCEDHKGKNGDYSHFIIHINNRDLLRMADKAFYTSKYPTVQDIQDQIEKKQGYVSTGYRRYTDWDDFYIGDKNDMRLEFINEFISLIDDVSFEPQNQKELCERIKYDMMIKICGSRKGNIRSLLAKDTENFKTVSYNEYGEKEECDQTDKVAYEQWRLNLSGYGYVGIIKELIKVLLSTDIKNILTSDSVFQQKVIDILRNNENDLIFAHHNMIIEELRTKFNAISTESQISRTLETLYERLMICAVGYVDCERWRFGSENNLVCPIKNLNVMLTDETSDILAKSKNENSVCDNAYIRAYQILTEKINELVMMLRQQGLNVDKEKIADIALYQYGSDDFVIKKNEFWHFSQNSDGLFELRFYNHLRDNVYAPQRKRTKIYNELPMRYDLWNCVIICDNERKTIEYLQKENRLFYVGRKKNDYFGYRLKPAKYKKFLSEKAK